MHRSGSQLREDAEHIWHAGVAAVLPERLIQSHIHLDGDWLTVEDESIDLRSVGRIAIVGGGKAAGAMATAFENVLGPRLLAEKNVTGWVNVPSDCVPPNANLCSTGRGQRDRDRIPRVRIHAGRPAGINEPRPEGIIGTQRILEIVSSLGPNDLCFCMLAGGGSALLPAPVPEISLDDKIRVTRLLSAAGANIEQLNAVRRALSLFKGGGLARACVAGRLITLIISDVLGDPLESIASGPTVHTSTTAADAFAILQQLKLADDPSIAAVVSYLRNEQNKPSKAPQTFDGERVTNLILGNNATAVDAAGSEAERLGYSHAMVSASAPEGPAEEVGCHLAEMAIRMRDEPGPDCLISGGEPTVTLVEESRRGKGGRNQQLALAALTQLGGCRDIALLSAGTDGEDGPTDAAGASVTAEIARIAREKNLNLRDYLSRNDAYHFFQSAGGLFLTGPTQTNVCDLRVITVSRLALQ